MCGRETAGPDGSAGRRPRETGRRNGVSSANDEKTEDEDELEDDYDFGTKGEQLAAPCTLLSLMNLRKGFAQKIAKITKESERPRWCAGNRAVFLVVAVQLRRPNLCVL